MRARLNGLNPLSSIGVCDVVTDLFVKFLYLLVSMGGGADGVSFGNELFGGFTEVSDHVRDVTLGNVVF